MYLNISFSLEASSVRKCSVFVEISKIAYHSLIESHIQYSIILWGFSGTHNLNTIFKIQKQAIRAISKIPFRSSCEPHFKRLGILTVPSLYVLETVLYVKKHNLIHSHSHNYNTRNRNNNSSTQHRLKLFEQKPDYWGQKFYHGLPEEIKSARIESPEFKSKLKKYLVDRCYYSLPT
jgi:hypothetical protein